MTMSKENKRLTSEFYELKVEQVIDKKIWDIPLIKKEESISHILSILDGKSHVWVVNNMEEKKLVGVITRHDVLNILAPPRTHYDVFSLPKSHHHGTAGRAEDVMTRNPIISKPDEKIVDVLQKMIRHRTRRLPVINDEGKIGGEITLRHLIHIYYKAMQYHSIIDEKNEQNDK
jgi:CBS domain-containing protein